MSATDLEYAHPADNIAGAVVPTVTVGTIASGYSVAQLYDDNPARPSKFNETTIRLVWDYGAPVAPVFAALVHANFTDGLTGVKYQGHTSSDFTSPAYSKEFPAATYHEDQFPANLGIDLREDAPSYRYWSLVNTVANVVPIALGLCPIYTQVRSLDGRFVADTSDDEEHPLIEHKTDAGVTTLNAHGTRLRWVRGDVVEGPTNALAIRSWNRATQGRALPYLLLPHLDGDEPWFVRWEKTNLPRAYIGPELLSRYRLEFEEAGRGLKPTPSAV